MLLLMLFRAFHSTRVVLLYRHIFIDSVCSRTNYYRLRYSYVEESEAAACMYVVVTKRYVYKAFEQFKMIDFLQYLEKNPPFRFLVHINNRLLKTGLSFSNVNQPVCHTALCMQSAKKYVAKVRAVVQY